MEEVYVFKAALKYRKGVWRRIEIKGNQTLADFDSIMRKAFNHDTEDHLSEFFPRPAWSVKGFGDIDYDGCGPGARKQIANLGLSEGDELEYVYDFGDDIQHVITLEKVEEAEKGTKYPRIISKDITRHRNGEAYTKKKGQKTLATWI